MLYLSGAVHDDLPAMLTPRMRQLPPAGLPWAADTGCFASPHEYADATYLAWLERLADHRPRCLFATAPDVFNDGAATLVLALPVLPAIRAAGYPAALVAQPGLLPEQVPWHAIDALFLGGATSWKLGAVGQALALEARRRGLWLHMGRVNSLRRWRHAAAMGCDSADGTILRFGRDAMRPRVDRWLADYQDQPTLWRHRAR